MSYKEQFIAAGAGAAGAIIGNAGAYFTNFETYGAMVSGVAIVGAAIAAEKITNIDVLEKFNAVGFAGGAVATSLAAGFLIGAAGLNDHIQGPVNEQPNYIIYDNTKASNDVKPLAISGDLVIFAPV